MKRQLTRRLTLAVLMVMALSSLAFAGAGTSETSSGGKTVSGTGNYVLEPNVNGNSNQATLTCAVQAGPAANVVSTAVHNCRLYKGDTLVATAPASARQTPAWATTRRMPASSVPAGLYKLCWEVSANFDDTSSLSSSGCGTITVGQFST